MDALPTRVAELPVLSSWGKYHTSSEVGVALKKKLCPLSACTVQTLLQLGSLTGRLPPKTHVKRAIFDTIKMECSDSKEWAKAGTWRGCWREKGELQ